MDRIIPFDAFFPLPFRVLFLVGVGILGWASNLHGLDISGVDVVTAMDLGMPEGAMKLPLSNHQRLASHHRTSTFYIPIYRLFVAYSIWCFAAWAFFVYLIRGDVMLVDAFRYIPAICALFITIVLLSQVDAFQKLERDMFLSAVWRCLFSPSDRPINFSDVVLADIFTSFAKVLGDVWLSACMLLPGGSVLNIPRQEGLSRWILPTIMSLPYLIRFRQCLIEYNTSPSTNGRRPLYNAVKYASSFPVIYLSAALRIFPDPVSERGAKEPWQGDIGVFRLWLLAAAVNSLYSFWWDVTNDWGLELLNSPPELKVPYISLPRHLALPSLHQENKSSHRPSPSRHSSFDETQQPRYAYPWGLRSLLLFPLPVYPLLLFFNLILRLTWSIKLSSHLHSDPDGSAAIFWLEIAELLRRWMWVFLRVEWEVVRRIQEGEQTKPVEIFDADEYEMVVPSDTEGVREIVERDSVVLDSY